MNDYVLPENAYWAAVPQLAQLFSNAQLSEITGNEKAHWASIYDVENEGAASLLSVLNISEVGEYEDVNDEEDDSNLTDAQREKIEFADKLKAMGINEEDLEDFREFKRQKEAQKRAAELERNSWDSTPRSEQKNTGIEEIDDLFDDEEDEKNPTSEGKKKINKATTDVIKDITRRTRERGIVCLSHTTATAEGIMRLSLPPIQKGIISVFDSIGKVLNRSPLNFLRAALNERTAGNMEHRATHRQRMPLKPLNVSFWKKRDTLLMNGGFFLKFRPMRRLPIITHTCLKQKTAVRFRHRSWMILSF